MKKIDSIRTIGVAGAGIMGPGIAQAFIQNGYDVILHDLTDEILRRAMDRIQLNQKSLIKRDLLSEDGAERARNRLTATTDRENLKDVDFLVEAITEEMDTKRDFFATMDRLVKKEAIFVSNTSGLSITKISGKVERKGQFAGMHWWNPPHLIPLVEVIRGGKTTEETAKLVMDLSARLGKKPVLVLKDAPGFIGNRLQFALFREALHIVEQAIASPEDVDMAMKMGLGFRLPIIGPFETADLGGLDTFYAVSRYLFKEISSEIEPPPWVKTLVEKNHLGVKTGKGFYDYPGDTGRKVIGRRDRKFLDMIKYIFPEKDPNA